MPNLDLEGLTLFSHYNTVLPPEDELVKNPSR